MASGLKKGKPSNASVARRSSGWEPTMRCKFLGARETGAPKKARRLQRRRGGAVVNDMMI